MSELFLKEQKRNECEIQKGHTLTIQRIVIRRKINNSNFNLSMKLVWERERERDLFES